MPCYYPWQRTGSDGVARPVGCGRCHGCRLEYSRQWAVRCMNEAQMHELNSFITLTYRSDTFSLDYRDFQLFMKRLRARYRVRIRFYMCGEYGETNGRAHFHACLFGFQFPDLVYFRKTFSGSVLYTSASLDDLWGHGFATVGDVTFESAAYCARYVMKKQVGDGLDTYEILDPDTGEIFVREKEFCQASLRPGIGHDWLRKYYSDVYPHGKVVVNGRECSPPRYYDKLYRRGKGTSKVPLGKGQAMVLGAARAVDGRRYSGESLPGRLEARSEVAKARLSLLKRSQ